jgi:hypothetical protein
MTNLCLASKRTFRVLLLELRKFVPTNISTFTVIKLKLFRITVTTDKNKNMTKHSSSHTPHRRSWHGPPPLFLTFCLQIYFQYNFFISLLFHHFFLILPCSCQYSYNLMLTSNCVCRPYIDTNNTQGMQLGRFKIVC